MITPIYAALLALIYVYLSARVIKLRMKYQVGIGDGQQTLLTRAIRVQGNFGEYVPFALLLVWMYETLSGGPIVVHVLGGALLAGRLLHAYGVSQKHEVLKYRQIGMVMTFVVIVVSALLLLFKTII